MVQASGHVLWVSVVLASTHSNKQCARVCFAAPSPDLLSTCVARQQVLWVEQAWERTAGSHRAPDQRLQGLCRSMSFSGNNSATPQAQTTCTRGHVNPHEGVRPARTHSKVPSGMATQQQQQQPDAPVVL